ncbi:toxin glutamine deamidase domain-containing protein [Yersinia bercovieri]|uniref:toxin glutamine deamidase domain-containing protein n=1 Tax=Yersinia bercovieri TaxID=634 RepID=UPI0009B2DB4E|nr:toxin glutamine deamidase domain-containing protein [Yersinia bercovieri]
MMTSIPGGGINQPVSASIAPCKPLERKDSGVSLQSTSDLGDGSFEHLESTLPIGSQTYIPPAAIKNREALNIELPDYTKYPKKYFEVLLKEVNRDGKPPFILRPLSYLLAKLGIHGFGQTNCASCATAVIDTLENNKLYRALPTLRGADVKGNMGLPVFGTEGGSVSVTSLITQLQQYKPDSELYGVLVIHRPAWRTRLLGATKGHACNVIKFKDSDTIHFLDTQKKTYLSCEITELAKMSAEISHFLGAVGKDGIDLYQKKSNK